MPDEAMLAEKKAAAYFAPWKFKIARLKKNDHVFLYRSGVGIVATGKANGKLKKVRYHGQPEHADEEFVPSSNMAAFPNDRVLAVFKIDLFVSP